MIETTLSDHAGIRYFDPENEFFKGYSAHISGGLQTIVGQAGGSRHFPSYWDCHSDKYGVGDCSEKARLLSEWKDVEQPFAKF